VAADRTDAQLEGEGGDCSNGKLLSTGDMARLSGNTLRTVRFYEEAGLVTPVSRSDCGHRMFARTELAKLQLVSDLREGGLSLQDIKALFELKAACPSAQEASARMSELLTRQIEELQRKIGLLRRLREELASTIAVISECRSCTDARFPLRCNECEVLARPDLPRAVRLLWST